MKLANQLLYEPTQAISYDTVTFNAPGVYYPPYGRQTFLLQGQGEPGNSPSGGNYAGTNPTTGGNYAGTNPGSGGNYAGTNPPSGGNYAGTNPSTPGNAIYAQPWSLSRAGYVKEYDNVNKATNYYYVNPTVVGNGTSYGSSSNVPIPSPYYANFYVNYGNKYASVEPAYWSYAKVGGANISSYNPSTPGNPYYNPYVPGNPYYNPYYPGNPYYNPTVPGNDYYNPYYPGNAGATNNVLGVTLPGGGVGSSAPIVGYTAINISYTNAGTPVPVPTGGYIKIQNNYS